MKRICLKEAINKLKIDKKIRLGQYIYEPKDIMDIENFIIKDGKDFLLSWVSLSNLFNYLRKWELIKNPELILLTDSLFELLNKYQIFCFNNNLQLTQFRVKKIKEILMEMTLPERILNKIIDTLSVSEIINNYKVSEEFVIRHSPYMNYKDWGNLRLNRPFISSCFVKEFAHKFNWYGMIYGDNKYYLNKKIIKIAEKSIPDECWTLLAINGAVSEDLYKHHGHKINWLSSIANDRYGEIFNEKIFNIVSDHIPNWGWQIMSRNYGLSDTFRTKYANQLNT